MADALAPSLQNLVDQRSLRWIFVGGKGGVGKTTTSCSIAVKLASERSSVLIISTDPAHNLSDAFQQKFTSSPTLVKGVSNLYAMVRPPRRRHLHTPASLPAQRAHPRIHTRAAQVSTACRALPAAHLLALPRDPCSASLPGLSPPCAQEIDPKPAKLEMEGLGGGGAADMLKDLSASIPGIDETMAFAEVMKLVNTLDYETIVFDTAPTGHTLRLMAIPATLDKALSKLQQLQSGLGPLLGSLTSMMGGGGDGAKDLFATLADLKAREGPLGGCRWVRHLHV